MSPTKVNGPIVIAVALGAAAANLDATLELEGETCRDDGTWCALDR